MRIKENTLYPSLFNQLKLSVYFTGYLYADTKWSFHHYEPCHRLYYITSGNAYFITESGNKVSLKKGFIYVLPRRNLYQLKCDDHMEKFFLHFDLQLMPGLDLFDYINDYLSIPFYSEELYDLKHLATRHHLEDAFQVESIIWRTFSILLAPHSDALLQHAVKLRKYETLITYIKEHCEFGLSLDELAKVMNISPSYLSRIFKKDLGMTVKEYVDSQLVDQLKKELTLTNKSIQQIARELKFSDEFYLSKYFKKFIGVSPKNYQQINDLYLNKTTNLLHTT